MNAESHSLAEVSSLWQRCGVVCIAGFGGMTPTLCRLATSYATNPETPLPNNGLYLGLFLFFVIACILCIAFEERSFKQAFIIGVSAPGIITNVVSGISDARSNKSEDMNINKAIY